jgi:hypothetical protein
MKKNLAVAIITLLMIILIASPLLALDQPSRALQARLFKYISSNNPYKTWKTWQGEDGRTAGSGAHGEYFKKYVNDVAYEALANGSDSLPYGSIIVQENYSSWGLTTITVMLKEVRGFNPEGNDWFFAVYSPNGMPQSSERESSCLGCHKASNKADLLISDFRLEYGKVGMAASHKASSN